MTGESWSSAWKTDKVHQLVPVASCSSVAAAFEMWERSKRCSEKAITGSLHSPCYLVFACVPADACLGWIVAIPLGCESGIFTEQLVPRTCPVECRTSSGMYMCWVCLDTFVCEYALDWVFLGRIKCLKSSES